LLLVVCWEGGSDDDVEHDDDADEAWDRGWGE
jgi:hypothetical protein